MGRGAACPPIGDEMLNAAFEDIGLPAGNGRKPVQAIGEPVTLDVPAAASLRNVLFFLSLAFRYPREAVYAKLERLLPVFKDFFDAYAGTVPELPEIEALQAEYIRLFVNSRGRVPAVPYASFHLDGGILMGESYHRLRQVMEKTGFVLDESAGELEDHLAIVLEYGSMLADRLMESPAPGGTPPEDIPNILGEVTFRYLRPTAEAVLSGISASKVSGFYATAARALFNFMADAEAVYTQIFGVSAAEELTTGVKT